MALVKRYSNRKLYHSEGARYVTLEDIAGMVRAGEDVRVLDHASGRDLTTLVLMQAVFAEEKRMGERLPRAVLTRLLQDGEETISSLRARMLAAFDPQRQLEEELRWRVQTLVERGEMAAEDGLGLVARLLAVRPAAPPPAEPGVGEDEELAQALLRQVAALEDELARLQQPGDPSA